MTSKRPDSQTDEDVQLISADFASNEQAMEKARDMARTMIEKMAADRYPVAHIRIDVTDSTGNEIGSIGLRDLLA